MLLSRRDRLMISYVSSGHARSAWFKRASTSLFARGPEATSHVTIGPALSPLASMKGILSTCALLLYNLAIRFLVAMTSCLRSTAVVRLKKQSQHRKSPKRGQREAVTADEHARDSHLVPLTRRKRRMGVGRWIEVRLGAVLLNGRAISITCVAIRFAFPPLSRALVTT